MRRKRKKNKKDYATVKCAYCGNIIDTVEKPIKSGDLLIKGGNPICAKCLYKKTRPMYLAIPHYKSRIERSRQDTILLAKSKTLPGQRCPSDCRFRNSSSNNSDGCSVLTTTYIRGECPFYKSRGV